MSAAVLFGKLPARADFVRRGEPTPILDTVDGLTQRALRAGTDDQPGPRYRVILAPPSGPHVLAGAMQLSQDSVGRRYPLVVGRAVGREHLDPATAASWPLRWRSLTGASAGVIDAALTRARPLDEIESALALLPELASPVGRSAEIDRHVGALAALPAHALWTRIWGRADPARAGHVFCRLASSPRGPLPYGLAFPLPPPAPDFGRSDAVAVWLAACWYLVRAPTTLPTLLWRDGRPGVLYVFSSALAASTFRALLTGVPDTDRIAHVADGSDKAVSRSASSLPSAFRKLLRDPRRSVADVLARLDTLR